MILFVDGVDGSGKSTLVEGLLDRLATLGTPAVLAPPLWTFLTPINEPQDFAGWVQRTPGAHVARHLLAGMGRRVDKLGTDLAHGIARTGTVIVADRGPKTIVCSALAHASTGRREDRPADDSLVECIGALEARVKCLASSTTVAGLELISGTPELILHRLAHLEELNPAYERYLRAFSDEMTTALSWPGIRWLGLPADGDLEAIIDSAVAWVQQCEPASTPSTTDQTRATDSHAE